MLRLDKVLKPWKESAELCDHINLYGFWNNTAFLTKCGDIGMVLKLSGVDYECLNYAEQEYAVKRLEAALKNFGSGFLCVPADEVVDKALGYVFTKDRDFQEFLRTPEAGQVRPSLRIRHAVGNGGRRRKPVRNAENAPEAHARK